MSDKSTIHIVDDDRQMRDSLRSLVESVGLRARTYESAQRFIDEWRPEERGCILVDVRMPGMSGIELLESIEGRREGVPVIMLSGYADVATAVRAMKCGALDFVEKPFSGQALLDTVHRALDSDRLKKKRFEASREVARALTTLTPREKQVLAQIVAGHSSKGIAEELGVSRKTVEVHRAHVLRKLSARGTADLVRMVVTCQMAEGETVPTD